MNRWKLPVFLIALCFVAALAAFAWIPPSPVSGGPADQVVVEKSARRMTLFQNGQELCNYRVALGGNPVGPKLRTGDHKTPEGSYVLDRKNASSGFHVAMHVSYPHAADRDQEAKRGVDPGGSIMVQGIKNGLGWLGRFPRLVDWTDGCIALTDSEMEQFWILVPVGTPIEIRP
jgi:murein L,D-transpeptidase YafK